MPRGKKYPDELRMRAVRLTIHEQVYLGERKALKSVNAYRSVPLSTELARALASWHEATPFGAGDDPVFASSAGTPMSYANLYNRVLAPARAAAGIPAQEVGGFHAFRRTFASAIHNSRSRSDRELCDLLGHHDPAFTVREYVGRMDEGIGDADFLEELLPVTSDG